MSQAHVRIPRTLRVLSKSIACLSCLLLAGCFAFPPKAIPPDPSYRVETTIASHQVWSLARNDDGTKRIIRREPRTGEVLAEITLPDTFYGAEGYGNYTSFVGEVELSVWVCYGDNSPMWFKNKNELIGKRYKLYRVDVKTNSITDTIPIAADEYYATIRCQTGAGALWFVYGDGNLYRVDAMTAAVAVISLNHRVDEIEFAAGYVWAPYHDSVLYRIDPRSFAVISIPVPPDYRHFTTRFDEGFLWILGYERNLITKVDPATAEVVATIRIPQPIRFGGKDYRTSPLDFLYVKEGVLWLTMFSKNSLLLANMDLQSRIVTPVVELSPIYPEGSLSKDEFIVFLSRDPNDEYWWNLFRINTETGETAQKTHVMLDEWGPHVYDVTEDSVWLTWNDENYRIPLDPLTEQ